MMGEPYRTKHFAFNAGKRLVKDIYSSYHISAKDLEVVEFSLTEAAIFTF